MTLIDDCALFKTWTQTILHCTHGDKVVIEDFLLYYPNTVGIYFYVFKDNFDRYPFCPLGRRTSNFFRVLGSIHSHFVHSISNSTVHHFDKDTINIIHLFFVPIVWWRKWGAISSSYNRYKIALTESVSKWSTVEFGMELTKLIWIEPCCHSFVWDILDGVHSTLFL